MKRFANYHEQQLVTQNRKEGSPKLVMPAPVFTGLPFEHIDSVPVLSSPPLANAKPGEAPINFEVKSQQIASIFGDQSSSEGLLKLPTQEQMRNYCM
jgi:hypothetical protein